MKNGVRIIECLSKGDPGSEGSCLKHLFDLMEVKSEYILVKAIDDLLEAIENSPYKFVHISTHGATKKEEIFRGLWTPQGIGTRAKAAGLNGKVRCTAIISTACRSGVMGFGNHVVDKWGSDYFIGPRKDPLFPNAILFSHLFYYKLFVSKKSSGSVKKAFNAYKTSFNNPHEFRLFARSS